MGIGMLFGGQQRIQSRQQNTTPASYFSLRAQPLKPIEGV